MVYPVATDVASVVGQTAGVREPNQQNLTPATVNQAATDQWLTPTDATYAAREFAYWARKHDLTGEVSILEEANR